MKLIVYILSFICVSAYAQTKLNETLIAIQISNTNNTNYVQEIIAHNFVNHVYAGKIEILKIDGKKNGKDYLRFDEGKNTIHNNRYLISEKGNIIDLKEKKVLYDGSAKLIRCSNDSVIFFINDIFSGSYYSYFNLKTNTYQDITSKNFKPNLGQNVEFDLQKSPSKLYLVSNNNKELLLEDAGKVSISATQGKQQIPIYWVDDKTFLFPKFKITDTEGEIIKYSLANKTSKPIGNFNSTSKTGYRISFTKTMNDFVEFNFKDKYFLINPLKESMLAIYYKDFDFDFSVSTEAIPTRVVYYKGIETTKDNFNLNNFVTSQNYAAYISNQTISTTNKKTIKVYSVFKKKWELIDTENTAVLVGWIKNN